jgi:hypothetical protein
MASSLTLRSNIDAAETKCAASPGGTMHILGLRAGLSTREKAGRQSL